MNWIRGRTWFEELTGIDERSPEQVRRELSVDGNQIVCPSGKRVGFGTLETPRLSELQQSAKGKARPGRIRLREVVGDVQALHADPENAGSMFQVASQFNLLEMANPSLTPEHGVGIYGADRTQGPACAIACGGGTIYRNYFAAVGDQVGQSSKRQIDCAADLGRAFGDDPLWQMQNGYLFPTDAGLQSINSRIESATPHELADFRGRLRVGLHRDVDVTLPNCDHAVSQIYCSALPVHYGRQPTEQWTAFAKLVLDAAYEATFCAAVATGTDRLFLTLLGGGVFGNDFQWIHDAIERSAKIYQNVDLDVAIVSYGRSNPELASLVRP